MKPDELRRELREGDSDAMRNRRAIATLALSAAAPLAYIALWQLGVFRHIAEPPGALLDAEKVNGSDQAYARFAVPDAFLGVASMAATATLAAMGGERRSPLLSLATAAKIAFDAANAGKLTVDQWTKYRAFCLWCLLSASATFAMVPLAISEARQAFRNL
jgi:uncharacterized membrane protein